MTTKAQLLMSKAQKTVESFCMPWNRTTYRDKGADQFFQAGNLFKSGGEWRAAADAFLRAAENRSAPGDRATDQVQAAQCFNKADDTGFPTHLERPIEYFATHGRFSSAARLEREVAEWFEARGDSRAGLHYARAVQHYENCVPPQIATARPLKIKLGEHASYANGALIFGEVARSLTGYPVLARPFYLRTGLCHLVTQDTVAAQRASLEPRDDLAWESSREYRLLMGLIKAVEESDVAALQTCLRDYDAVTPLDAWHIGICRDIKKSMEEEGIL